MAQIISKSEAAKIIKVTPAAITKAIKSGAITEVDGGVLEVDVYRYRDDPDKSRRRLNSRRLQPGEKSSSQRLRDELIGKKFCADCGTGATDTSFSHLRQKLCDNCRLVKDSWRDPPTVRVPTKEEVRRRDAECRREEVIASGVVCRHCGGLFGVASLTRNTIPLSGVATCRGCRSKMALDRQKSEKIRFNRRLSERSRREKSPGKFSAKWARDRAARKSAMEKAVPKWLTELQKRNIEQIYNECREASEATGVPHEVDHIVPLRGRSVCGLHVPWNLRVITREENGKKGNRYEVW